MLVQQQRAETGRALLHFPRCKGQGHFPDYVIDEALCCDMVNVGLTSWTCGCAAGWPAGTWPAAVRSACRPWQPTAVAPPHAPAVTCKSFLERPAQPAQGCRRMGGSFLDI